MRHFSIVLTVATIATAMVLPNWPENAGTWAQSVYTYPDSDFSIAFPGPPDVDAHAPQNDDAPGSWTYLVKENGISFSVRIDQYPKSIRVPDPTPFTYQLLLRGHAVETSSRLVSTGPVLLGKKPALQGVFASSNGGTELRRVLMVGHRVYQVSYSTEGPADPGQGAAFLDSFKLSY